MFETMAYCDSFDSRRVWSACLGFTGEVFLIAGAALVPLIAPQALEQPRKLMVAFLPIVPPGTHVAPIAAPAHTAAAPATPRPHQLVLPGSIPPKAQVIQDAPADIGGQNQVIGGFETNGAGHGGNDLADSVLRNLVGTLPVAVTPERTPVAPPVAVQAPTQRVKVGGRVKMARPISQPMPRYPDLAKNAHISGVVELLAVIGVDGRIRELKVTGGNPLLARAALEAVRTWVYEPTMLNGEPVEVVAPVTVTFHLN